MKKRKWLTGVTVGALLATTAPALDLMEGVMNAVPTPGPVTIDGKLDDWDRSAREWVAVSPDNADRFSGELMVMYDDDALYLGGEILTSGGPLRNLNKPGERPWIGHDVEFRCVVDPDAPWPLEITDAQKDDPRFRRIKTITLWQETVTGTPHLTIVTGPPYRNLVPGLVDPPEAELKFSEAKDPDRYFLECRIPWQLLGVENGKNPFRPGQAMTAFWTLLWPQGMTMRIEALRTGPTNNFGYDWWMVKNWGKIHFLPEGNYQNPRPSLKEYLAGLVEKPQFDSFTVEMPEDGLLSVNVVDAEGRVLREIAGGEFHRRGPVTLYWDGHDWRGNPMPPGEYEFRAYKHDPLTPVLAGAAGTSAKIPYETSDGKGNWGGNFGPPTGAAATADGRYYLWGSNEGGNSIVKTDPAGNILWRTTPYVMNGGYGPHVAIDANDRYVLVVSGWMNNLVSRYDAKTGLTAPFDPADRVLRLDDWGPTPPVQLDWVTPMPAANSIAVGQDEFFVPFHYRGVIKVYDLESGKLKRELPCAYPAGVTLDEAGNLYAISGGSQIVRFDRGEEPARNYASIPRWLQGQPWDLAVRGNELYLSDNRASHQVAKFINGKFTGYLGTPGGRVISGRYDPSRMRNPAGIALGPDGKLLVAQASLPNVFQLYDTRTGALVEERFGDVNYTPATWPEAGDPLKVYVAAGDRGLIRSQLKGDGSSAGVDAYWQFEEWPFELRNWMFSFKVPRSFKGLKGHTYIHAPGLEENPITLIRVDGEKLTPVNYLYPEMSQESPLHFWRDLNGDGLVTPDEVQTFTTLAGEEIAKINRWGRGILCGSYIHRRTGDLYLLGVNNAIYQVPFKSVDERGVYDWDFPAAKKIVNEVIPGFQEVVAYGARGGFMGIDVDDSGNIYVGYNVNLDYAKPEWTRQLRFGLGHTGSTNAVKLASFAPDGTPRFLVGRKATGVLKPGELYHSWTQAGLWGNDYVALASEWTPFTLYTTDGFFVQTLLGDANRGEEPSPTNIGGGETFSGQLVYDPDRNEAYLYTANTHGMVYRLEGIGPDGKIKGEKRWHGKLRLTRAIDPFPAPREAAQPEFLPLTDPLQTGNWGDRPVDLYDNNDQLLAKVYLGYDATRIYARFEVKTPHPFVNRADDPALIFKRGDAVGLYFGFPGERKQPAGTDVRILATVFQGKPAVAALIAQSDQLRQPYEYYTSAGGRWKFDFAGLLPDSEARFTPTADGYTLEFAVPRRYLPDYGWKPGNRIAFEAEVLLSGNGVRGLQTISRNHLFTPRSAVQAKMVDDIPSEARSYPEYFGTAVIR